MEVRDEVVIQPERAQKWEWRKSRIFRDAVVVQNQSRERGKVRQKVQIPGNLWSFKTEFFSVGLIFEQFFFVNVWIFLNMNFEILRNRIMRQIQNFNNRAII